MVALLHRRPAGAALGARPARRELAAARAGEGTYLAGRPAGADGAEALPPAAAAGRGDDPVPAAGDPRPGRGRRRAARRAAARPALRRPGIPGPAHRDAAVRALLAHPALGPRARARCWSARPAGWPGGSTAPTTTRATTADGLLVAAERADLGRGARRPARRLIRRCATGRSGDAARSSMRDAGRGRGHGSSATVRYRDRRSPPAGRRPAPAGTPPRRRGGRRSTEGRFRAQDRLGPAARSLHVCSPRCSLRRARLLAGARPRTRSPTRAAPRSCARRWRRPPRATSRRKAKLDNSKRRRRRLQAS